MVTGDHPATARAVAEQVGLAGPDALVAAGADLPADEDALGRMLDRDGLILARVAPEDKLRIARALQKRGHVVAMTGDGVNDGPALRQADIGVAMGASGTDVAREAADLVLLDDHFATIVAAVELGRATYTNIRRFLTYHLTDNVAELVPFVAWAITGGKLPLALGVLQILALDIGTDLLPALALGAEPANPRTMTGRMRADGLISRSVIGRVFGVLGPAEAVVEMTAFVAVLLAGGWTWGEHPLGCSAGHGIRHRFHSGRPRPDGDRVRLPKRNTMGGQTRLARQPAAARRGGGRDSGVVRVHRRTPARPAARRQLAFGTWLARSGGGDPGRTPRRCCVQGDPRPAAARHVRSQIPCPRMSWCSRLATSGRRPVFCAASPWPCPGPG